MRKSNQPSPAPSFQRPAGIPVQLEPERGRSSLDIPRRGSPWNTSSEAQNAEQQQPHQPMALQAGLRRTAENGGSPRQRPVSMGPWSLPRTPLTFRVQPPRSPPKPTSFPGTAVVSTGAQPATIPAVPVGLKSPYAPPVPQSRSPNWPPRLSQDPPKLSLIEPDINSNMGTKASQAGIGKISLPPPVNRANKPGLASGRSTPTSQLGGRNLDAVKNEVEDRISPFSTPPSSDSSPEAGSRSAMRTGGVRSSKTAPPTQNRGYFPPPPTHPAVEARREARNGPSAQQAHMQEAREVGSASKPSNPAGRASQLPGQLSRRDSDMPSSDGVKRSETISVPRSRRPIPSRPRVDDHISRVSTDFLPPPKRNAVLRDQYAPSTKIGPTSRPVAVLPSRASNGLSDVTDGSGTRGMDAKNLDIVGLEAEIASVSSAAYPDGSQSNRRAPWMQSGTPIIDTTYDTRLFDVCSRYVCATGYLTKAWDLKTGKMIMDLGHGERDIKITAIAFKPGTSSDEEGARVWLGSNYGDIQEVDLSSQSVIQVKPQAHDRREIVKIYRHQNSMWSLDEGGKLLVWLADDQGLPNLQNVPLPYKVSKGHSFSIVIGDKLWLATGKEIRIYKPGALGDAGFFVIMQPLSQTNAGEITSGAVISNQLQRVYFGHTDGKVSMYSTTDYNCLAVVNVSVYKINTLAGAGFYLWAGYNTGMIYVYDTRTQPWQVKKDWVAHTGPVLNILTDHSSVWKLGYLQVASIGVDNSIKIWDGVLEDDWLENDMHEHDTEYCEFGEITAVVATWNAGASTPTSLRHEEKNNNFFREVIRPDDPPDIIVFGFQELVDLEDKKLTAKSLFKGSKKKESSEHEHMSRQYRAWRDFLVREIEDNMPTDQPYHLLHTASMVGLFSCIFVKESLRNNIRELHVAEIKRGLGGFHGNKGAILLRFVLCDSSLCFVNCHLAAGQTQTVQRNNDIASILEANSFPAERDPSKRIDNFIGGGDGSMIMDHEICVLNGDLNYRIDTMGRDAVVKAVKAKDFPKLLERDQLLVSRRRNPGFRLRAFNESPITFAPTYKYDVGTDNYDSSEKHRSPAWCDRILYRGVGRIKQTIYQRHELRVSDHRPVSGVFKMRVKSISPKKRVLVWQQCEERLVGAKEKIAKEISIDYLVSVLGVGPREAAALVEK
ncbi:hypothetical protein MMC30_004059 [Trapelia coarctata]|nr:hypothetical protein [Trapelia coarctata]